MISTIKRIWGIFFNVILFPMCLFLVVFGPFVMFTDLLDIYKLGAPRSGMSFGVIWLIGLVLYLSMRFESMNWLYRKFPVSLPLVQMCFISLLALEVSITCANLWADKMLYGKGIAIFLSVVFFLAGRAFLSYWYYKYPVSYQALK